MSHLHGLSNGSRLREKMKRFIAWPDSVPPAGPRFHTHILARNQSTRASSSHLFPILPSSAQTSPVTGHERETAVRTRDRDKIERPSSSSSSAAPTQKNIWPAVPIRKYAEIHKTRSRSPATGNKKNDEVSGSMKPSPAQPPQTPIVEIKRSRWFSPRRTISPTGDWRIS